MTEKERYGIIAAFKRLFAQEGVVVDRGTLVRRIEEGKRTGVITIVKSSRLKSGQLIREGFYAESEVRAACQDLFNQLNAGYFSEPGHILHDFTAYARHLGEDKTPLDLNTSNIESLSITCHNGKTVKGSAYLSSAAIALGLAKNFKEASSKHATILTLLLKTAGIEIRDGDYYQNGEFVSYDLAAYARQLGEDKTPLDLNTGTIKSLSVTCHNGETVRGATYLKNAAIALGLAKNVKEAGSKEAETLRKLKEIAGRLPKPNESDD